MGTDVGASSSASSGAQSGAAQSGTGDFNVTFSSGGGLSGLLPKTLPGQAWIVWAVVGVVAVVGLVLWFKK